MAPKTWLPLSLLLAGCARGPEETPLPSSAPDEPGASRGLAYGEEPSQALDLFVPQGVKGEPLVAFVHGGAWQGGSRHEYDAFAARLKGMGIAAASVDYRLSPGVRHPAHAEDAAHALAWLRENAPKYGYDPRRIFVVGHSAGGHIAGTIATDPTLLALAKPAGFVGLEGIYDVPNLAKRWPGYPDWFLNNAFGRDFAKWHADSPTRTKVAGRAPWLLVHSKGDELVDMGQTDGFAAHLRAAGIKVETLKPGGETHSAVVGNLARPEDAVAKAIVAFVQRR